MISSTINISLALQNEDEFKIDPNLHTIKLSQSEEQRPLLLSIEDNGELIRERNDTLGNGAIYRADVNTNITITYFVINGNNETNLRLYADVPPSNLSLSTVDVFENQSLSFKFLKTEYEANYTAPYTEIFYENATLSHYSVELNVTTNYINFFAAIPGVASEIDNDYSYNFISTLQTWQTESEDEFYIQVERANITISAENVTTEDVYGIKYRKTSSLDWIDVNFTKPVLSGNYSEIIDLGEFDIDTTLEWISYAYLNNSVQNETIRYEGFEHKFVEYGDGSPSLSVDATSLHPDHVYFNNTIYSQSSTVNLTYSATVIKGNISEFRYITYDLTEAPIKTLSNITITPTVNASLHGELMFRNDSSFSEGKYEIVLIAYTNKGLQLNETIRVFIDQTNPLSILDSESYNEDELWEIYANDGRVTFSFNFSDENSGVRYAYLDFSDGTVVEVTEWSEYTHTFLEFDRTYTITLTIIDWAGNSKSTNMILNLYPKDIGGGSAPLAEWYLILVVILLLLTSPLYGSKLADFLRNIRK
jgi:hypothetical protein